MAIIAVNNIYAAEDASNDISNPDSNISSYKTTSYYPEDTIKDQSKILVNKNNSSNNEYNAAGSEDIETFNINEIEDAASKIRAYVENNRTLPKTVVIGSNNTTITMSQLLELLATTTLQINQGNNNSVILRNFTPAKSPIENIHAGNIYKAEYLKIAGDVKRYMDSSGKTPDFAYQTSLGTYLRFENLVYMYSMILQYHYTSGKIADFAMMEPWSVIISKPVIDPNAPKFTVAEIEDGAARVRAYVETWHRLPSYVKDMTTTNNVKINVYMPQFLELLATTTLQINQGNNDLIPLKNFSAPKSPIENIRAGNIYKAEYLKIAGDVKRYMDSSGKTPDFAYQTSLGTYLRFENLVYMYSMILQYHHSSSKIADFAMMEPWSVIISKPVINPNATKFTVAEIEEAAAKIKYEVENNHKLPLTITIGTIQVNMSQLLELLSTATLQINQGNNNSIILRNFTPATSPIENIHAGNIYKTEYLKIANDIKNYMDSTGKTPDFAYQTSLGTYLRFENLVYMYGKILDYHKSNDNIAGYVAMEPWSVIISKPVIDPNAPKFTIEEITEASIKIKNQIEISHNAPTTVTIGTTIINMQQFLELLTTATLQINSDNNNSILLKNFTAPVKPLESIHAGNIYKTEYLKIASDVKNYMDSSGKTPDFAYQTSLGTYLRFENLVYMYTMVLDYYNSTGNLTDFVVMKPWDNIINPRPVYITSDNIMDPINDTIRVNYIINSLKEMGITAYNCGLGPNTHYAVLENSSVPTNALVVDIYGGACAGTIWEMGTNYYKQLIGTKKVFCVWLGEPLGNSVDITGLAWLPRAHDDNFSPISFTGLAHPDQYLLKNGYHYIYTNDLNELVKSIYYETTSS